MVVAKMDWEWEGEGQEGEGERENNLGIRHCMVYGIVSRCQKLLLTKKQLPHLWHEAPLIGLTALLCTQFLVILQWDISRLCFQLCIIVMYHRLGNFHEWKYYYQWNTILLCLWYCSLHTAAFQSLTLTARSLLCLFICICTSSCFIARHQEYMTPPRWQFSWWLCWFALVHSTLPISAGCKIHALKARGSTEILCA